MARFGEQRVLRGTLERGFFRVFGVADPSHYLHHRYLARFLASSKVRPARILDAGCGRADHTFWLARRYPSAEVVAIDIDPELVEAGRAAASQLGIENVEFRVGDLGRLDLQGFDLIVSIDVLEHVPDQPDVLRRLRNALHPDGVAFFHLPTERPKPVLLSKRLHRFHAWAEEEHIDDDLTLDEFTQRVRDAGFDLVEVRQTFGRWSGEAACSLFALPYQNTPLNRVAQVALAPLCRVLALADAAGGGTRYAVAVACRRSVG